MAIFDPAIFDDLIFDTPAVTVSRYLSYPVRVHEPHDITDVGDIENVSRFGIPTITLEKTIRSRAVREAEMLIMEELGRLAA